MSFFQKPPTLKPLPPPASVRPTGPQRGLYIDRRPKPVEEDRPVARDQLIGGGAIGRLFDVKDGKRLLGFFDSRAFWCSRVKGELEVRRGAPRAILERLTDEQRRVLRSAQITANKKGLR